MLVRNRDEQLEISQETFGVKCRWKWTSDLYLPKVIPLFGTALFSKSLNSFSFQFNKKSTIVSDSPRPSVSFIIGHRGTARLPLLLKTIESIAAQQDCNIECIVVEQDAHATLEDLLPKHVKYIHSPPEQGSMPFSRAMAFNVGARHASGSSLIFHDNDLLIPTNYASETHRLVAQGFDFVNLKRFIFYLSESATHRMLTQNKIEADLKIDSIMQNAEGGGSIGASRESYFKIGGFDERFIGWGGEDNEFWERAQTTNVWPFGFMPLVHLWHGAQAEKLDHENSNTTLLYKELSQKEPVDRIKWLIQNQASMTSNSIKENP